MKLQDAIDSLMVEYNRVLEEAFNTEDFEDYKETEEHLRWIIHSLKEVESIEDLTMILDESEICNKLGIESIEEIEEE